MSQSTKENLLRAADQVFATRGFRDATIQEIATLAGANIAAIHYHFGDKANFYAEWIARSLHRAVGTVPTLADLADPRAALRAFVAWFLRRIAGCADSSPIGSIQMHEMASPSPLLDRVVEKMIRPELAELRKIVRALLPKDADEPVLRRHVFSIVGQCTFYRHARPVITRLDPSWTLDDDETIALVDHIVRFSLAGIEQESQR